METVLHRIKAYLYENTLTKDNSNDYIARVSSERGLNVKQICRAAVQRGGSDIAALVMEHAVNLFLNEMAYQLCDGYSVNTGYFTASTQIKGVFDSPSEKFNSQKHSILFRFNQGESLRKELSNIEVEMLGLSANGIGVLQVTDVKSDTVNDLLTPGRSLKIVGKKLKVAGESAGNGVYFINQSTDERTKVENSDIILNNPSELWIIIPELNAGTYQLEITTQFSSGNSILKEPRSTLFDRVLIVE